MTNVLLVDDEPSIRWTMAEFLKRAGHDVQTAANYAAAVALLDGARFDTAVVDINLPDRSGLDLLQELHARAPHLPVIMITGEPSLSQVPEIVRAGAYDFIAKPVIKDVLLKAVARAVERKRLADERQRLEQEIQRYAEELEQRVAARTDELRRSEAALRESEQRYRLLFATNPLPTFVCDLETQGFLAVNEAAVRHYGYTAAEFRAMTAADIHPPGEPPTLVERITTVTPESGVLSRQARHRKRDGTVIQVEVTSRPFAYAGRPALFVLANDITERLRAEEELRQMQARLAHNEKIAALGRVAAQIAHEVKNPLAGLLLYAMHLQTKTAGKLAEGEAALVAKIIETIKHLTNTVEQVSDFARPVRLNLSRTDLNRVVEDVLQLLRPQLTSNRIAPRLSLRAGGAWGLFDSSALRAALMNLMLNAVQAMPDGGTLAVTTDVRGGRVTLELADTGTGMTPEQVEQIFEPFYTTRRQGLGLGMPYARKVLEQHEGRIAVESRPGAGTTVRVELPAAAEE